MTSLKRNLALLASSLLLTGSLYAAPLPESYVTIQDAPLGTLPTDLLLNGWYATNQNAANGSSVSIRQDSGNLFGKGTNFKYLEVSKNTTVNTSALNFSGVDVFAPTPVITLSFLLYQPTSSSEGLPLSLYFGKGSPSGANLGGYINLSPGKIMGAGGETGNNVASYATNTALRFDIVINNSSSTYVYGEQSLGGRRFDVWVDGNLILDGAAFVTTGSSYVGDLSSARIIIPSGTGQQQTMYFGELGVFQGGVVGAPIIPEPGTATALIGAAALGLLLVRSSLKKSK